MPIIEEPDADPNPQPNHHTTQPREYNKEKSSVPEDDNIDIDRQISIDRGQPFVIDLFPDEKMEFSGIDKDTISPLLPTSYQIPLDQDGLKNPQYRGGVCYGLTWLMARAFKERGIDGIDKLLDNLLLIKSMNNHDPMAGGFRTFIETMQAQVSTAYPLNRANIAFTIPEINERLSNVTTTTSYKFGTENHAMMLGANVDSHGNRIYVFYNPSSELYFSTDRLEFWNHITQYFTANSNQLKEWFKVDGQDPATWRFEFLDMSPELDKINPVIEFPFKDSLVAQDFLWNRSVEPYLGSLGGDNIVESWKQPLDTIQIINNDKPNIVERTLYDKHVIIQLQGDVNFDTAKKLFLKHYKTSDWIQWKSDNEIILIRWDASTQSLKTSSLSQDEYKGIEKLRISWIGHRSESKETFGGKTFEELKKSFMTLSKFMGSHQHVYMNLVGCELFDSKQPESNLAWKLSQWVMDYHYQFGVSKENLYLAARKYKVRVNDQGKKEYYTEEAGSWQPKEGLNEAYKVYFTWDNNNQKLLFKEVGTDIASKLYAKGMSNQDNLTKYARVVKDLIADFRRSHQGKTLTKNECEGLIKNWAKKLQRSINEIHSSLGIPQVKFELIPRKNYDKTDFHGAFGKQEWKLELNIGAFLNDHIGYGVYKKVWNQIITFDQNGIMDDPSFMNLLEEKLIRLAGTLYHEGRHAEQDRASLLFVLQRKLNLRDKLLDYCKQNNLIPNTADNTSYNSSEGVNELLAQISDMAKKVIGNNITIENTHPLFSTLYSLALINEAINSYPKHVFDETIKFLDNYKSDNYNVYRDLPSQTADWIIQELINKRNLDPGYYLHTFENDAYDTQDLVTREIKKNIDTLKNSVPPLTFATTDQPNLNNSLGKVLLIALAAEEGGQHKFNELVENIDKIQRQQLEETGETPAKRRKTTDNFASTNFGYEQLVNTLHNYITDTFKQNDIYDIDIHASPRIPSNELFSLEQTFEYLDKLPSSDKNTTLLLSTSNHSILFIKLKTFGSFLIYDSATNKSWFARPYELEKLKTKVMGYLDNSNRRKDYNIQAGPIQHVKFRLFNFPVDPFADISLQIGDTTTGVKDFANTALRQFLPITQNGIGDGYCYARAALDLYAIEVSGNLKVLEQIDKNWKAISESTDPNMAKLNIIPRVHDHLNQFYRLNLENLNTSIEEITARLATELSSSGYKLGTRKHAMAIGVNIDQDGKRTYYVIDRADTNATPGKPTIEASDINDFKNKFTRYFNLTRCQEYGLNHDNIRFEFIKIANLGTIINTPVELERGVYLSLEDITTSDLPQAVQRSRGQKQNNLLLEGELKALKIENYALLLVEADNQVRQLQESTERIFAQHRDLSVEDHILLIDSTKKQTKANGDIEYVLKFYNKRTKTTTDKTTTDPGFLKVQQSLDPTSKKKSSGRPSIVTPMSYYFFYRSVLS